MGEFWENLILTAEEIVCVSSIGVFSITQLFQAAEG